MKREIIHLRRYIAPVREVVGGLIHSESALIRKETHIYLRDLLDHILRVIESIEIYREILSGLTDIYISGLSTKMNEVMKVLTVFASVFCPAVHRYLFPSLDLTLPWFSCKLRSR